jgi:SAM-dependent methyltransferase
MEYKCRVCSGNSAFEFRVSSYNVLKCQSCSVFFFEESPTNEVLSSYYADYSYSHLVNLPPAVRRSIMITLNSLRELVPGTSPILLDYGCGQGDVVLIARELGFEAYGFEVSESALRICSDRGVPLLNLNELRNKRFNVVTAFEVIEHLPYPGDFFSLTSEILCRDGLLYFTTPNADSLSNMRGQMGSLLYPEHLCLFSKRSVSIATPYYGFYVWSMKTEGFKSTILLRIRDMAFLREADHKNNFWKRQNAVMVPSNMIDVHSDGYRPKITHFIIFKCQDAILSLLLLFKAIVNIILDWFGVGETLKVTLKKAQGYNPKS